LGGDLVILTFAEQTDRFLTLHGGAIEAEIGGLNDEAVLHETQLPSNEIWEGRARSRQTYLRGRCLTPAERWQPGPAAKAIRSVAEEHRAAVRSLPGRILAIQDNYWPNLESSTRLDTATEVDSLLHQLDSARSEIELIKTPRRYEAGGQAGGPGQESQVRAGCR
jgi:hypothetical protein